MVEGGYQIKTVKRELARDLRSATLHVMADIHIGDKHFQEPIVKDRISQIAADETACVILNGDLMNTATRQSPSDIFAEQMTPTQQLTYASDLLSPIAHKIIAITGGNHEARTWKNDGVDITRLLVRELGIEDAYSPEGVLVFLRFGAMTKNDKDGSGQARMICYTIYATHGSGGGRKEGSKAIRLADMASIVDADIYIHSHTHLPMIMRQAFYRTNQSTSTVTPVDKLFVNTGTSVAYGGYAQAQEYKPASTETPVILLSGTQKYAQARL